MYRTLFVYLFHFNNYYGNDRVVLYPEAMKAKAGDCILLQWQYFLVLGKDIVRWCDYQIQWELTYHIAEKQLISSKTMQQVHWMVQEYFSRYMYVVPLRLGQDIEQLLKRKTETTKKKITWTQKILTRDTTHDCLQEQKRIDGEQSLLIFPNLWALHHYGSERFKKKRVAVDSGNRTEKQRNSTYWKIKAGEVSTLLCTASGVFQDRKKLSHTHIHQPHQRWYKSRREPRYDVVEIIKQQYTDGNQ